MTIRGVTWTLDTCDCVIQLTYDDTTQLDTREYTLVTVSRVCAAHSILADTPTKYDAAKTENNRKNQALQLILDNVPVSLLNQLYVLQADGVTRVLKKGIRFQFTITGTAPNRVLNISFINFTLTTQQRTTAQAWLDNRFGVGRVILS